MNRHPAPCLGAPEFGATLRSLMQRPTYAFTPGWLSKVSGIPKATIVNWLEGRVARPRSAEVLAALCDALRLTPHEASDLYRAAAIVAPLVCDGRAPFDRTPVGLYRTTPDGRILHVNATLIQTLGYQSLREFIELNVASDLYARPAHRVEWLSRIVAEGTLRRHPVRAKRADGSEIELLDSANAVRDDGGPLLYFEGVWEHP